MRRIWTVARREYLERVRSKAFIIGTVLAPVIMAAFMVVPMLMMQHQHGKALRISVVDATGHLRGAVEKALEGQKDGERSRFEIVPAPGGPLDSVLDRLRDRVVAEDLDGVVVLPADALEASRAEYQARNVAGFVDVLAIRSAVEGVVVKQRLASAGFDADRVSNLTRGLDLATIRLTASGAREDHGATVILAVILMMLIYTSVLMWGTVVMNGVIEEKTSRVVELVASSVSPARLLAGKLLGIGGAGLTQFLVWMACLLAIGAYGSAAMGMAGVSLPEVGFEVGASFVVFFLLGFFLYALLFAAIGSAVNSTQEAQPLTILVMTPLIASMIFMMAVIQRPDSGLSVTLSLIPFFTPLIMFLRIVTLTPPLWQVLLSVILTLATILALTWVTGRIYRVGILMYGKKPTFPELLRWTRQS